jgi:mono/diheme cytochrome c family protein
MDTQSRYKAEIDFRELLAKPEKLFGYTYPYFLVLLVALGSYYVTRLTDTGKNSVTPLLLQDSSAFAQDIPYQSARVLPPVDIKAVSVATPELLKRGRELFAASCASCHGENGLGDGPAGAMLNPRPRNFHSSTGWTNGAKISQIYKTLEEGIVRNGMASYNYLPPYDRFALIHYVRRWQTNPPHDTEQELAQLETVYQLSKGITTPGQIPIKDAMARIIKEQRSLDDSVHQAAASLFTDLAKLPSGGALERAVRNPQKVLTCFPPGRVDTLTQAQFVTMVSADPPAFGFRPSIVEFSPPEWASLYALVVRRKQ